MSKRRILTFVDTVHGAVVGTIFLLRVGRRLGVRAWRELWPRMVAGGEPAGFAAGANAGAEQALP